MFSYGDMTYCPFDDCANFGDKCNRSLTDEVQADADKWFRGWCDDPERGAPICVFTERPNCFEEKNKKTSTT